MKRILVLAVFLSAYAVVAQNVGTVVIYRSIDHRRGRKPIAFCDEQRIAEIQGGKYVIMNVSSGKHAFTSSKNKSRVEVDVKPGEQYFIRINEPGELELVPAVHGREQTERLQPLESDKVSVVCRAPAAGQ